MERSAVRIVPDVDENAPLALLNIIAQRDLVGPQESGPTIVPERILVPLRAQSWHRKATSLTGALLVHGGFIALFMLLIGWRDLPVRPETAIPVEIVSAIPDMPRMPKPDPPPAPTPIQARGPVQDTSAPEPKAESPMPPPLQAPPPEPMRAATQPVAEKPVEPTPQPPVPDTAQTVAAPPPRVPRFLSTPQGSFVMPTAAPSSTSVLPASSNTPGQTPSVNMADVLPMDFSRLPSTFRAMLSSDGAAVEGEYKGLVFGRIERSHGAVEAARAKHLHGQVIVSFGVDAQGRAADLKVASSSGNPAIDALGLDMVREAEPFPPPPPGSKQIFTPSFSFGDE